MYFDGPPGNLPLTDAIRRVSGYALIGPRRHFRTTRPVMTQSASGTRIFSRPSISASYGVSALVTSAADEETNVSSVEGKIPSTNVPSAAAQMVNRKPGAKGCKLLVASPGSCM
jgi:hypothetical protein